MRKNVMTLSLKNIISFSRNITSHFTGKTKIITLAFLIIMLSFINITFTSALSYQGNVGIGFTFNPTLSVNISPSNLVIDSLTPSITADSNTITVSVATNAAYGYTLSAMVNGNNNNNGNNSNNSSNSNLTHTNGTSMFSSIATDASLSSLTNDNTWGYSYRLSNSGNSNAWSNYSGLSNETIKTLVNTDSQAAKPIDFKIAAKASETQPSGAYTGVINFTAVSKHIPVSLAEAYASEGKTMTNGFYTMQDMTSTICSKAEAIGAQLQVLDKRDGKLYWISKLADQKCWMTQNLELDLNSTAVAGSPNALTSENTNLKTYGSNGYDSNNGYSCSNMQTTTNCTASGEIITWVPARTTVTSLNSSNFPGTTEANSTSYSYNPGDKYYYPSASGSDTSYTLAECNAQSHIDCAHYKAGNYYNWSASVASNNTSSYVSQNIDADNSICPKGWRLPKTTASEFKNLVFSYGIITSNALDLHNSPLYFVRSGFVNSGSFYSVASGGYYWSDTVYSDKDSYSLQFGSNYLNSATNSGRRNGFSVRCIAE